MDMKKETNHKIWRNVIYVMKNKEWSELLHDITLKHTKPKGRAIAAAPLATHVLHVLSFLLLEKFSSEAAHSVLCLLWCLLSAKKGSDGEGEGDEEEKAGVAAANLS